MHKATGRCIRVLVADDKAFIRTTSAKLLKLAGIEDIAFAANGREAVTQIAQADPPINLVFCDLMMPDMDGVEVVRHVADTERKPAFVFVSGANAALLTTAVDMARARGLSVLGTIEKPMHLATVELALSEFAGASPACPPVKPLGLSAADLTRALDRDQLIVHYQPKVKVKSREVAGFEALARWRHPEHGLVPPGQFISLAEEADVIGAVTDRVLQLALGHCAEWNRSGLVTKVSINMSAQLLVDLSMPDRMARDVWLQGLSPKQFIIEVTESGALRNAADTLDILARLHMKGFALSIDDFGTGYSSMEQLRRVAFSELKIDRAFVHGAAGSAKTRAILSSSVALGKSLALDVVAEGAETQEEWDLLTALGVDSVQGYFVAKPMPHHDVFKWCKAWARRIH